MSLHGGTLRSIQRAGSTCQGSTTHIVGEGWCVGAVKLELRLRGRKREGKEHWSFGGIKHRLIYTNEQGYAGD
jgi:hypothetical protein